MDAHVEVRGHLLELVPSSFYLLFETRSLTDW